MNINDIFRVGVVVETDPENCLVRVKFPDADELVSGWLQVLQQQTLKNKHYYMPDIDELVACIFLGSNSMAGFVLGAVYNKVDAPPYNGQDLYYKEYDDKTLLQYDRKTHELTGNIKGNVIITVDGNEGGEDSDAADGTVDVIIKDAVTIAAEKTLDAVITEDITIEGKALTVIIDDEHTIEASKIAIKASGDITIEAGGKATIVASSKCAIDCTAVDLGTGASFGVIHAMSPCPAYGIFHLNPSQTVKVAP